MQSLVHCANIDLDDGDFGAGPTDATNAAALSLN
jgi:hypothetical protein